MAVYEVYLSPESAESDSTPRLVADSASLLALFLPLLWLVWHRLWFWVAVYLLAVIFLNGLATTPYSVAGLSLAFLPGLFIWLEGPNLIAAKYEHLGFALTGLVTADNEEAAELKWSVENAIAKPAYLSIRGPSIPGVATVNMPSLRQNPLEPDQ